MSLHDLSKVLVVKFGGSCLANTDKMKLRAELISSWRQQGYSIVVVVSAMGNTTNDLVKLAYQVSHQPQRRELDMLLTTGERVSMALLSMILNDMGCPTISFTGSQAGILTESDHNNARIVEIKPVRVVEELNKGKIVIVAGFQGVNPETKEITTIGRGGSDTTAMAFAKYFRSECRIFKDVPGICTADPKKSSKAKTIPYLSHDQLLLLCQLGSQVLHVPAVELAKEMDIEYKIVNAENPNEYTTVSSRPQPNFKAIVSVNGVVRVDLASSEFIEKMNSHRLNKPHIFSVQNLTCFWGNIETLQPILLLLENEHIPYAKDKSLVSLISDSPTGSSTAQLTLLADIEQPQAIEIVSNHNHIHSLCDSALAEKVIQNLEACS